MTKLSITINELYSYKASIGLITISASGYSGGYQLEVVIMTKWGNKRTIHKAYKTLRGIQKAVAHWNAVAHNAQQVK